MTDLLLGIDRDFGDYHGIVVDYPRAVQQVVDRANEELWWRVLLAAARRMRPSDPDLADFAEDFDLAPIPVETTPDGARRIARQHLEARVRAANEAFDVAVWRSRLGEIESRVCRVECPAGTARGTGFLVGPDVVITNYHVMERVIEGDWKAEHVALRFDYKVLPGGVAVASGKTYKLAAGWDIDHSPYSSADLKTDDAAEPADDELDYALLRVDGKPGSERLAPNDPTSAERRWIEVPPAAAMPDFATHKAVFIVQHPDGKPMQVALDSEAVLGVTRNGTRLRYATTTARGSSGSPCFGADWQWIALHHSGDPMYPEPTDLARFNRGIPVPAIVRLLESRGKVQALGANGSG